MSLIHSIPLFSIFLPLFLAFLVIILPNGRMIHRTVMLVQCVSFVMNAILTVVLYSEGSSFSFTMGHVPAPWGNELRAGPFESLLATVYSAVMLLSMLGGETHTLPYIKAEKQALYGSALLLLGGSMLALIYTNDLFTAYVFLELSTIAACIIIMVKDKGDSLVEAMRYLIMYIIGSTVFLLGIVLLYSISGHLLMEPLKAAIQTMTQHGRYPLTLTLSLGLLTLGLAIKSAVVPFHSILPGAHGVAVTTSSCILSALLLESYIILLIKLIVRVFSIEVCMALPLFDGLLFCGLLAMVVGSVLAMGEGDLKRMLAYSSAAQIGYIYVGIGMGNEAGIVAATFHIIAHAFTKSLLFSCAGKLISVSGSSQSLSDIKGAAWRDPMAGIGFTLGGISLVGVPLLACFVSKLYLAQSVLDGQPLWRMAVVLFALGCSMLLNALYFIPAVTAIWSKETAAISDHPYKLRHIGSLLWNGRPFITSVTLQIAANLALGVYHLPVVQCLQLGLTLL